MRVGIHNNRRHANHSRLALPKLISKCHFPCLRHYDDSDSGSDLQQESLLDNDYPPETDSCHMTGPDWGYHDDVLSRRPAATAMETMGRVDVHSNQENMQPSIDITPISLLPSGGQQNQSHAVLDVPMATSPPVRPLSDCSNVSDLNSPGNTPHYQMPKFNGRMWQDGFGRFRRDTIPRRDNIEDVSPTITPRESFHVDTNPGGPTWFISPSFAGLGSTLNNPTVSQKSSTTTSINDLMEETFEPCDTELWDSFENDRIVAERTPADSTDSAHNNLAQISSITHDIAPQRPPRRNGPQLVRPEHSSSLAQVLHSLPDQSQHNPYASQNQNSATSTTPSATSTAPSQTHSSSSGDQDVNQGEGHSHGQSDSQGQGHPSLFAILERLQRHIQDSSVSPPPEGVQVGASQNDISGLHGNSSNHSHIANGNCDNSICDGHGIQDTSRRSNTSTVSSIWSNRALIQHILQALTNHSPAGSTHRPSPGSTQSSASSQGNWYFYDRRLVLNSRCDGDNVAIMQPPSYEEAQTSGINLNLPGINTDLLTQLGFLYSDPPPPYPGSDITPPAPYPGSDITPPAPYPGSDITPPTPYPGSDITPPPPYHNSSSSSLDSFMSEVTSESDIIDLADRFSLDSHDTENRNTAESQRSDPRPTLNLNLNFTMVPHSNHHSNQTQNVGQNGNNFQDLSHHDNQTHEFCNHNTQTHELGHQGNQILEFGHHDNQSQVPDHHGNNMSEDQDTARDNDQSQIQQISNSFGLGGRPPVRWNRGMRLERWTSTHNWGAEPSQ